MCGDTSWSCDLSVTEGPFQGRAGYSLVCMNWTYTKSQDFLSFFFWVDVHSSSLRPFMPSGALVWLVKQMVTVSLGEREKEDISWRSRIPLIFLCGLTKLRRILILANKYKSPMIPQLYSSSSCHVIVFSGRPPKSLYGHANLIIYALPIPTVLHGHTAWLQYIFWLWSDLLRENKDSHMGSQNHKYLGTT